MRAFSKSQGKFIEVPDAGATTAQPTAGGGMDTAGLKTLMMMAGLSNVKNASKYSSAMDLIDKASPDAKTTAEQRNRAAAVKPALEILNEVKKTKLPNLNLLETQTTPFILKKFGGRGVSRNLASLNSQYANLKQLVVKAYQGGRMSDRDYEQASQYIPDIIDTPTYAQDKISNLEKILTKVSDPTYVIGYNSVVSGGQVTPETGSQTVSTTTETTPNNMDALLKKFGGI